MDFENWTSIDIPDDARLDNGVLGKMMEWCNQNTGQELESWDWLYFAHKIAPAKSVFVFRFKDKEHAILFKLIWV